MDSFLLKEKAQQQYDAANHLFEVTLPLIKDPKLLMGIINNISASLEYLMNSLLEHEKKEKLILYCPKKFQDQFNLFRSEIVPRNKIPPQIVNLILTLKETLDLHQKSPTEFPRRDRFIVCNKEFDFQVISAKSIKEYLKLNKEFLDITKKIVKS